MKLTFSGGTAQQRQWVQDALAASSYPYDALPASVEVTWATTTPCGLRHTYMCTSQLDDGSFLITITERADDPTNPEVAGLPNPAADIKRFYMESFIHETGHVIHATMINTDEERTQAAGLFWTAAVNSTGRLIGDLSDYSFAEVTGIAWADSIIEAIAETVKIAFYRGDLLYGNRTVWHVDEPQWPALMAMLMPPGAAIYTQPPLDYRVPPVLTGDQHYGVIPLFEAPDQVATAGLIGQIRIDGWGPGDDGNVPPYDPLVNLQGGSFGAGLIIEPTPGFGGDLIGARWLFLYPAFGDGTPIDYTAGGMGADCYYLGPGDSFFGAWPDFHQGDFVLGHMHQPDYHPPFWVRLIVAKDRSKITCEWWVHEGPWPAVASLVGAPTPHSSLLVREVIPLNPDDVPEYANPSVLAYSVRGVADTGPETVDVREWQLGPVQLSYGEPVKAPPYPYAELAGAAQVGVGATGTIAVG